MDLRTDGDLTVVYGEVTDQAHLQGLIHRLGVLGLELVDVYRHDSPAPRGS